MLGVNDGVGRGAMWAIKVAMWAISGGVIKSAMNGKGGTVAI